MNLMGSIEEVRGDGEQADASPAERDARSVPLEKDTTEVLLKAPDGMADGRRSKA